METYTVERRVGRLLEMRLLFGVSQEHTQRFLARVGAVLSTSREPLVLCVDLRDSRLFPPEISEQILSFMRTMNPYVERSALLVGGQSAMFGLQIERLVRGGAHPSRRTFRDPEAATRWLAQVLTPAEQERLRHFVAGAPV